MGRAQRVARAPDIALQLLHQNTHIAWLPRCHDPHTPGSQQRALVADHVFMCAPASISPTVIHSLNRLVVYLPVTRPTHQLRPLLLPPASGPLPRPSPPSASPPTPLSSHLLRHHGQHLDVNAVELIKAGPGPTLSQTTEELACRAGEGGEARSERQQWSKALLQGWWGGEDGQGGERQSAAGRQQSGCNSPHLQS